MSRRKDSNDILTRRKGVRVGKRVLKDGEPQMLVGPQAKKDLYTIQDMTEDLYGPGYKYIVIPPDNQATAI